ncbi:LysR family transcriptional regulator [Acanthopleuribacter pedis]|uniref:LysR family transcriptional regulator n=1 Tax=Acanthopleuribacter pedis TaxID=442870 RepID=A0A8J7U1M2_9BACT|nr:LysR family transcriptional regulator [Acanthopleuribacter pedis]MBO1317672.1 LysR family transcriptional regulator [Acanthopleuribacter pedis]
MTLDQLLVLDTILTHGSFRAAAEVLNRSQPALSVAIRKLEETLGFSLFDRTGYRPVITPAGQVFHQKAQMLLRQAEGLNELGRQLAAGKESELTITITAIAPMPLILSILKRFEDRHPDTRLHINFEVMSGNYERLIQRETDFSLTMLDGAMPEVSFLPLAEVTMIPVAAPALARAVTDIDTLRDYVQVVVRDSASVKPRIERGGLLEGGRRWLVGNVFIKKEIILAGLGWGSLPDHLIRAELAAGKLQPLRLTNIRRVSIQLGLARLAERPMGPVARELWALFQGEFSNATHIHRDRFE